MFVENKTKVASRVDSVDCSERAVLYFRELMLRRNSVLEELRVRRIGRVGTVGPDATCLHQWGRNSSRRGVMSPVSRSSCVTERK